MEDHQIIELFLNRNENALIHTKNQYGQKLFELSLRIVQDRVTAEECENDTYLRAWDSIPPNTPWDYFYPYLACIIRNLSINCFRRKEQRKHSAVVVSLSSEMEQCIPSSWNTAEAVDAIVLKETINQFLASLDEEKRNVFLRRYWFMDSVEMIAQRYQISQSKVKTMLHRTRKRMREFLEKEGYPV